MSRGLVNNENILFFGVRLRFDFAVLHESLTQNERTEV